MKTVTITFPSGFIGTNLGPFTLTTSPGVVTPSTASTAQLTAGYDVSIDDTATDVTITSTGVCTNSVTLSLATTTTTSSSTTTTSTSGIPGTTTTTTSTFPLQVIVEVYNDPIWINDTENTIQCNVISGGSTTVIERGVCWSITNTIPTLADNHLAATTGGTGVYTVNMIGLTPGETYYVRAYAINGTDTAYSTASPVLSFMTTVSVGIAGIYRYDNGDSPSTMCNKMPYQFPSMAFTNITIYVAGGIPSGTTIPISNIFTDAGLTQLITSHANWSVDCYWGMMIPTSSPVSHTVYISATQMDTWTNC
jgi:hypothetical protein